MGEPSRDLDRRTDRAARRLTGFDVPRDTYYWARLRVTIAGRDAIRTIRNEVTPAIRSLGEAAERARQSMELLTEALRRK